MELVKERIIGELKTLKKEHGMLFLAVYLIPILAHYKIFNIHLSFNMNPITYYFLVTMLFILPLLMAHVTYAIFIKKN